MKICVIEPYPDFGGGSERICFDLAQGLAKTDEVFLAHDQPGTMLPSYQQCCVATRQMRLTPFGWKSLPRTLSSALALRKQLTLWKTDALICSNVHMMRTLALATAGTAIRVLYHLGLPSSHPRWTKRLAFRRFHIGIAPSEPTMKTWLDAGWPSKRLCVVPNWVDTERFAPADDRQALRRKINLPSDRSVICFVGRLEKEKGIQTLLQAFAKLVAQEPSLFLILVGESQDRGIEPWRSQASQLGLTDNEITFAGRTSSPELYLAAADIAVVPSEWEEPFGLTVLEAMASCTPPVVTDVGILRDIVGDAAGLLSCQAGNVDDLAETLRRATQIPGSERNTLGCQLRRRVLNNFSARTGVATYRSKLLES